MSLEGHKRVGKRLITPLNQIGMNGVSYYRELYPELLWMGFIRESFVAKDAVALILDLAKKAKELSAQRIENDRLPGKAVHNFSLCSSYGFLNEKEKEALKASLSEEGLSGLQESLAPLILLYDEFPLAFLGPPQHVYNRAELLATLKRVVEKYGNKYEIPGLFIQATSLYVKVELGALKYTGNAKLPNLNAIFEDPESEEGRMAASRVRATVLAEIAIGNADDRVWSKKFWNQGARIDGCEF